MAGKTAKKAVAMPKQPLVEGKEPKMVLPGPLVATLLHDFDRYSNGGMLMKFADTHSEVTLGGKSIGHIGMSLGGTLYVEIGSRTWTINPLDLFQAVREQEPRQYLKLSINPALRGKK